MLAGAHRAAQPHTDLLTQTLPDALQQRSWGTASFINLATQSRYSRVQFQYHFEVTILLPGQGQDPVALTDFYRGTQARHKLIFQPTSNKPAQFL